MEFGEQYFLNQFEAFRKLQRSIFYAVFFIFNATHFITIAQDQQYGQGYYGIQNYSHEEDYPGHFQNWSITQDKNDFIYAANGDGILEFDGASWRLISAPGLQTVRTVTVDDNNVKWIGADRELGYLEPDSLGVLQYKSLKDKIPASHPLDSNIWSVITDGERVIFNGSTIIYSLRDGQFTIIPSPGPIYRQFKVRDKIYFIISGKGIYEVVEDTLRLIPNNEIFENTKILAMLPYDRKSILVAYAGAGGISIYDGKTLKRLENEVENYFNENKIYNGIMLPDSSYAFGTLRGGVITMDKTGKLIKRITADEGILNNQIHGMTMDHNKTLWLALQTGVSQVEPLAPYSFFDEKVGLQGTVSSLIRHKGLLYVGTYSGLYVLQESSEKNVPKFHKIKGINSGCHSLLSVGDDLLAATSDGTFLLAKDGVVQLNKLSGSRTLYRSKKDANRIFVGHMFGLSTIYFRDGRWQEEKNLEQIPDDIFSITSTDNGTLWLATSVDKVIKIEFPEIKDGTLSPDLDQLKIQHYEEGLPKGSLELYLIDDEVLVLSEGAGSPLFRLESSGSRFFPENNFGKKFGLDSLYIYPIFYQNDGEYMLLESEPVEGHRYRFSGYRDSLGSYTAQRLYDESFRSTTETHSLWDRGDLLWIGGENITAYELDRKFKGVSPGSTNIRRVIVGQDSVVYGGDLTMIPAPILNHTNAGLRFEFAAPGFGTPESNRYQYRLEGFETKWSDWSTEARKDYTNLPEGDYRFLARAQNIYGDVSDVGTFNFEILPPWFRTWWVYIIYSLLIIGFLFAILKWRSRQLKAKNEALERLVEVRTSEVRHQASQLQVQAEKLKELDKSKSRFFANISHEFRTPLTLIKGPIEQLEQNFDEKMSLETVKMIRRNANRVLNMVNQLLDLSKFDEGSLKLAPTEGDVFKCIRAATSSFNSHAAQRDIDYKVQIPQEVLWASFDRGKLENIIYNLLGNAFKFSGDGSEITFITSFGKRGLEILVSDSGKGIPTEKLPFIFDRFYQVDDSNTREKSGSGIGLSLSKDLVELMDGTIAVTSEVNKGTYFTLQLPIQKIKMGHKEGVDDSDEGELSIRKKPFALSKPDQRNLPTILLVEDNADMRHFIKEQLIKYYKVIEAINGDEGLKMAGTHPSDLIITDLMMPKMDGIELCKRLKTDVHTSHIPVIMLTAKAGMENKIEGLETGADDYLTKPFDAKELLVRAKNLIDQRQKLRELYSDKDVQVEPKKITVTSIDQKFLEELLSLLEEHHSNSDFGVPQMQEVLAMSKTQLHRKLKALTNEAPGELLRNFRLKKAAQLLSQKADSVTQIAYQVGFNNLSYFAKCFRELYGVAPSNY